MTRGLRTLVAGAIAVLASASPAAAASCRQLSLGDFGTVSFSNASATSAGGHTGTIADPAWRRTSIALDPGRDQPGPGRGFVRASITGVATPSSLSTSGRSFSVVYQSG
jgi:hypothetical protein